MGMGQDAAQLFASSSHRAILILKDTVVPMSSEFTPETERQRLQHLVSDSSHPSAWVGEGAWQEPNRQQPRGAASRIQLTALSAGDAHTQLGSWDVFSQCCSHCAAGGVSPST